MVPEPFEARVGGHRSVGAARVGRRSAGAVEAGNPFEAREGRRSAGAVEGR